jgi:hypothetical protein
MRIENIANQANDKVLEASVIGTQAEVEGFGSHTQFTADFVEEESNDEWSISIMAPNDWGKKEFKKELAAELKAYRKTL